MYICNTNTECSELQYFMECCLIYGLELEADSRFALLKTVVYI